MRGLDHHCIVKLLGVVLGKNMMLVRMLQFWWAWLPCNITFATGSGASTTGISDQLLTGHLDTSSPRTHHSEAVGS